jgi:hypothetical protein
MTLAFLNPKDALIFRVTHRDNLPWILDHGLHAKSSNVLDPNFRRIGDLDLIDKRSTRRVRVGQGGTLSDYVPFYFTPFSMMAFNIHTGHRGIEQVPNNELVILVSSFHQISSLGLHSVFTDQHAYRAMVQYFTDPVHLNVIDWTILQARDFKTDPNDPGKTDRYQAETLIWKYLPVDALLGICGNSTMVQQHIEKELTQRGLTVKAYTKEDWYF